MLARDFEISNAARPAGWSEVSSTGAGQHLTARPCAGGGVRDKGNWANAVNQGPEGVIVSTLCILWPWLVFALATVHVQARVLVPRVDGPGPLELGCLIGPGACCRKDLCTRPRGPWGSAVRDQVGAWSAGVPIREVGVGNELGWCSCCGVCPCRVGQTIRFRLGLGLRFSRRCCWGLDRRHASGNTVRTSSSGHTEGGRGDVAPEGSVPPSSTPLLARLSSCGSCCCCCCCCCLRSARRRKAFSAPGVIDSKISSCGYTGTAAASAETDRDGRNARHVRPCLAPTAAMMGGRKRRRRGGGVERVGG